MFIIFHMTKGDFVSDFGDLYFSFMSWVAYTYEHCICISHAMTQTLDRQIDQRDLSCSYGLESPDYQ